MARPRASLAARERASVFIFIKRDSRLKRTFLKSRREAASREICFFSPRMDTDETRIVFFKKKWIGGENPCSIRVHPWLNSAMLVWRKLSSAKWEDAWLERLRFVD